MIRISGYQLFVLTVLFQFGSTIVFGFASSAGHDAWLTALFSTILGSGLIALYGWLMRLQPGLSLVQWFPAQFGRWIGTLVAWLYPLAFLYVAGRVLRDFGDLLATTILSQTPFWVIIFLYMLLITYALWNGIETIARVGEMLFPIVVVLLLLLEAVLILSSNVLHFDRLLPVMEEGWRGQLKTIWPLNFTVPFGESIVFAMLWKFADKPKQVLKMTLAATWLYGVGIAMADAFAVASLGENLFKKATYPLLTLMRQIQVGNFLEHLEALIIVQGIAIGFFKITLFMHGAIEGIQQLTGLRDQRWLVLPCALIVMLSSVWMASNVEVHMEVGLKVVPYVLWVPLFLILPLLLLVVILIRKKWAKHRKST